MKNQNNEGRTLDSENQNLTEYINKLKQNEEHLVNDLLKQQKIAKDSLRALDSLSDKYEKEKRDLILRLEKDKEEILKRDEYKYELKINSLKSLNEQLN